MEIKEIALQMNLTGSPIFRIKCWVITSDSSKTVQVAALLFILTVIISKKKGPGVRSVYTSHFSGHGISRSFQRGKTNPYHRRDLDTYVDKSKVQKQESKNVIAYGFHSIQVGKVGPIWDCWLLMSRSRDWRREIALPCTTPRLKKELAQDQALPVQWWGQARYRRQSGHSEKHG